MEGKRDDIGVVEKNLDSEYHSIKALVIFLPFNISKQPIELLENSTEQYYHVCIKKKYNTR